MGDRCRRRRPADRPGGQRGRCADPDRQGRQPSGRLGCRRPVAATSTAVWAVSGGHFCVPQVFRIDPATNLARPFVATGNAPTAVAVGFGDLWVSDSFENTVTRVDPAGCGRGTIPVGHGPIAVAAGEDAVWVADSLDDSGRQDRSRNELGRRPRSRSGRSPSSIAVEAARSGSEQTRRAPSRGSIRRRTRSSTTIEIGSSSRWAGRRSRIALVRRARRASAQALRAAPAAASPGSAPPRTSRPIPRVTRIPRSTTPRAPSCSTIRTRPAPAGKRLVPEVAASLPRCSSRRADVHLHRSGSGFAFSPPRRER